MSRVLLCLIIFGCAMTIGLHAEDAKQYYELRQYRVKTGADTLGLDAYLNEALVPALNRQGIAPVGLFKSDASEQKTARFALIPLNDAGQVAQVAEKLEADAEFEAASKAYNSISPVAPVLERIHSELLVAFDVQPQINVPEICKNKQPRVFELRTYESATEYRGRLKVEMFNSGEVPIFIDCGIQPIFFGQALVGEYCPSLTYLTVYPNQEAKDKSWDQFRMHPDWKVLSKNPRFANTVSKIHKWNLVPMAASQL